MRDVEMMIGKSERAAAPKKFCVAKGRVPHQSSTEKPREQRREYAKSFALFDYLPWIERPPGPTTMCTPLIELVTQHGDGDRKRADDKIKHVDAGHRGSLGRQSHSQYASWRSSSADSCFGEQDSFTSTSRVKRG